MTTDLKRLKELAKKDLSGDDFSVNDAYEYSHVKKSQSILMLIERIEKLENLQELVAKETRIEKLEEALKFYSDIHIYDPERLTANGQSYASIDIDAGSRAREALKNL